jgi:hypothetical protein
MIQTQLQQACLHASAAHDTAGAATAVLQLERARMVPPCGRPPPAATTCTAWPPSNTAASCAGAGPLSPLTTSHSQCCATPVVLWIALGAFLPARLLQPELPPGADNTSPIRCRALWHQHNPERLITLEESALHCWQLAEAGAQVSEGA